MADATNSVEPAAVGQSRLRGQWAFFIACVALYLLFLLVPQSPTVKAGLQDAVVVLALAWTVSACVVATRQTKGKSRRAWRTLAVSMGAFLVGFGYRTWTVLVHGHLPSAGSVEDVAFLIGFIALIPVALLITDSFEAQPLRKVRNAVDFGSIVCATFAVLFVSFMLPLHVFDPSGSLVDNVLFVGFPVVSVSLVVYLAAFKRGRWRIDEVFVFLALLLSAAATLLAVYGITQAEDAPYAPPNVGLSGLVLLSFLFVGMGAWYRVSQRRATKAHAAPLMEELHWPSVAIQATAVAAIPALLFLAGGVADTTARTILVIATSGLAALVVARGALATLENRALSAQSLTDPLTGLFNERYFRERLGLEVGHALKDGDRLVLGLLDLDGYDTFCRDHGFAAADRRIMWFAQRLLESGVDRDLVFRVGEDDFAMIFPMVSTASVAELMRNLVEEASQPADGVAERLSFGGGIAAVPDDTTNADELVRLAQGAQYWAKTLGRGNILVFDPAEVEALDSREHVARLTEETHTRLVESLAVAVDARDPYTRNHSSNVAQLSEAMALECGLSSERAALVNAAAMLHDVGKIGVPDAILRKPTQLDPDEMQQVREHPDLAVRILSASARPEMLPWIQQHHERLDGTGYPLGLRGDEITLEARILAVCDAYDAITTDRPYRAAAAPAEALEELRAHSGTQFDPRCVELLAVIVQGDARKPPMSSRR